MGDYDPRGSTDEYGRPKDPESEPEPQSSPPPPESTSEPEQTVHGTDGHPLPSKDDRTWGMFCHLGALVVSFFSGLGFIVPLIIWLMKKDESDFIDDQGKESLNFQITLALFYLAMGLLCAITCGFGVIIALPLIVVAWIVAVVMGIIASIKSNEGERYRYPFCLRLIK